VSTCFNWLKLQLWFQSNKKSKFEIVSTKREESFSIFHFFKFHSLWILLNHSQTGSKYKWFPLKDILSTMVLKQSCLAINSYKQFLWTLSLYSFYFRFCLYSQKPYVAFLERSWEFSSKSIFMSRELSILTFLSDTYNNQY